MVKLLLIIGRSILNQAFTRWLSRFLTDNDGRVRLITLLVGSNASR